MCKKFMRQFSIMPLDINNIDNICEDIRYQFELGIVDCVLFCMSLHPEGTPAVDKAKILGDKYKLFKERLDAMGLSSGILAQSTIGHGYILSEPSPYKKVLNLNNGNRETICCPYDDDFCEYIRYTMRHLASLNPDIIMVDDDLRLIFRQGNGCACEMHMEAFNKLSDIKMSREELYNILKEDNTSKYADIFISTQKESVIKAATAMREGVDSVNPTLQMAFCGAGTLAEFATDIAKILAGENNPVMVRIGNGVYVPQGSRGITHCFYNAAYQVLLSRDIADVIIAEADTIPYNQYGISTQWYHSHYVGSVLEGANGAKRWITRLMTHEPQSGLPFRKLLKKNIGFYNELANIVPKLNYNGCKIPLSKTPRFFFRDPGWTTGDDGGDGWSTCVLERLGLPLYFSEKDGGAAFLNDKSDIKYSDEEILHLLSGVVFLASDTAKRLIARGFGEYLGVDIKEWNDEYPNIEIISCNGGKCDVQKNPMELIPKNDDVIIESMIYHTADNENFTPLFPGTTVYKNSLGGTVAVFCGTPVAEMNYIEGFSFLNYSRKEQLIKMLTDADCLSVYYTGTEEVYLKSADFDGDKMFVSLFNLGYDTIDVITLKTKKDISSVKYLDCDGEYKSCAFKNEDGVIVIDKKAYPMDPVIIIME